MIVNIILLNIIFGIIIDTFAELRNKRADMDKDKRTTCFICGIDRFRFDLETDGFEYHIKNEHNVWNYVFYMIHLKTKDKTDYNGIESKISQQLPL